MCHPGGGNIANPNLPLRLAPQFASFETFVEHIRNPTLPGGQLGTMPPISEDVLSDEEAWNLYQFIIHVMGCPPVNP
jgi:mono/diheme cytochrome c family protein